MRHGRVFLLGLILVPSLALAQAGRAPTESVTVTGTKSREVLQKFVGSLASPTRLTGKMARWEGGICPVTVGIKPQFTSFISQRIKDVAKQVGAPVNDGTGCTPNIAIVFTVAPQKLLDTIRDQQPALLGYYDNTNQRNRLATVTHPIQAWYMTETQDLMGKTEVDRPKTAGIGLEIPCGQCPGGHAYLPNATAFTVSGSRLGDGLRSGLYNVIIVADRSKLASYEIGELSDYIAMLALTEPASQDACLDLPSILNLLAENCATKASALTGNDEAFLHGLYKMGPGTTPQTQKDQISYQMEQELKGH